MAFVQVTVKEAANVPSNSKGLVAVALTLGAVSHLTALAAAQPSVRWGEVFMWPLAAGAAGAAGAEEQRLTVALQCGPNEVARQETDLAQLRAEMKAQPNVLYDYWVNLQPNPAAGSTPVLSVLLRRPPTPAVLLGVQWCEGPPPPLEKADPAPAPAPAAAPTAP
eukprot:EG_transcript_35552